MNKYEFTHMMLRKYDMAGGSVIDIGCRDGIMKRYLPNQNYLGVDVDPSSAADKIVDIGQPTEFPEDAFDVALALDVIEHTDNIYAVVKEIVRISRSAIIAVPNLYNLGMRIRFLSGRPLCGKYHLTKENSLGGGVRHRWVFTPHEACRFMYHVAQELDLEIAHEYFFPARKHLNSVARWFPILGSDTLFFIVKKRRLERQQAA